MTDDRIAAGISARINTDGSVSVPPRIARWLEKQVQMTADRRAILRSTDPEAYEVFVALHLAALGAECGTNTAAAQTNTADLTMWMSTSEAAERHGVGERCIRKWCRTGRIHAVMTGGRWLVRNTIVLKDTA
ncbi:helix-turn-helix domain-containing protein [Mycolicibacterium grossiae]|uniref:Helix-turn-helix domain-containing protein n=1 Tax=Mycolicibacterium grossiae TaxID=1552759 RepID=A0A1E8Q9B2_9MYCO|nr:helix-turn-helix domain-containing protein [Mycolicibacterium grossiae]OFJ55178.1 hypothetical protein BEL07_03110 [Mycolicibacterium grossiae]QEM46094.1 helix-turn-helix domain-containing protein [Mycolicibacterium grossiae]